MTHEEWEALCDGCARCCLHKLEDIDLGEFYYTNIACPLLDINSCQCADYDQRSQRIPGCRLITPLLAEKLEWLPSTCAYRRLALGKKLSWWHPLISGDPKTVHKAGISVRGKAIPEKDINITELDDHVINWIKYIKNK